MVSIKLISNTDIFFKLFYGKYIDQLFFKKNYFLKLHLNKINWPINTLFLKNFRPKTYITISLKYYFMYKLSLKSNFVIKISFVVH